MPKILSAKTYRFWDHFDSKNKSRRNSIWKFDGKKMIGYKKVQYKHSHGTWPYYEAIATLEIPASAFVVQPTNGKCRASKAKVLSIELIQSVAGSKKFVAGAKIKKAYSLWDSTFKYVVGETVVPTEPFDKEASWRECSTGIHFFIDRDKAERY